MALMRSSSISASRIDVGVVSGGRVGTGDTSNGFVSAAVTGPQ